jgi:hypothetical protein
VVTLFGTIVRQQDGQILFRVKPGTGDAAICGFRREGEIWLKRAQLTRVQEAEQSGQFDQVVLSPSLACQKADALREQQERCGHG